MADLSPLSDGTTWSGADALNHFAGEFNSRLAKYKEHYAETDSSALLFRLGREIFALPTAAVREVVPPPKIHSVPNVGKRSILGLANYQGELLLCVSLPRLIKLREERDTPEPSHRLLVLSWHGSLLGCPVGQVLGVQRFCKRNLNPPPEGLDALGGLVLGILDGEGQVAAVLSVDTLFASLHEPATQTGGQTT